MKRFVPTLIAAILVFTGWALLRSKVFTPSKQNARAAAQAVKEEILWSANEGDAGGEGDDPRAVFSSGLNRYLRTRISEASALPLNPAGSAGEAGRIDPTILSMSDELATVKATVHGVKYRGLLRWGANGWELIQLSRES
jgi:hypothetical protein